MKLGNPRDSTSGVNDQAFSQLGEAGRPRPSSFSAEENYPRISGPPGSDRSIPRFISREHPQLNFKFGAEASRIGYDDRLSSSLASYAPVGLC